MIGTLDTSQKEATVVGAGISGLLIAYRLKKLGYRVKVLEASNRVGGIIQTVETPFGIAESAAHSLMVHPEVKSFFDELGVKLLPVNPDSKSRFIVRAKKARRIPLSLWEILKTAFTFLFKKKPTLDFKTASLEDWSLAYLGKSATQFLMAPFVTGIFACRPNELNLEISFPRLAALHLRKSKVDTKPSPKKPRPVMMAPRHGMSSLIQKLADELKNEIQLNHPIQTLPETPNLILSVPIEPLSQLIESLDPTSAHLLKKLPYSSLVTTTVFYRREDLKNQAPQGVGVLMPRDQGYRILGVLYNSSSFSHRTRDDSIVSITVMMGGTVDPTAVDLPESEIKKIITTELKQLFKTTAEPIHLQITRWKQAIPIFSNDLRAAQLSLKNGFCTQKGRVVFTNFSREVSIRALIEAALKI